MTNFRLLYWKSLQTIISNVMKIAESSPKRVQKHCEKRKNHLLRAVSHFSTVFSRNLYCSHIKPGVVWEKVKLKAFADKKKTNVTKTLKFIWKRVELLWLPAFSPFLAPLAKGQRAIVQDVFFPGVVEILECVVKG